MWNRQQLKQAAKDIMSRHYWELFAAALVYTLLVYGASSMSGIITDIASLPALLLSIPSIVMDGGEFGTSFAMTGVLGVSLIATTAVGIFVTSPLEIGCGRYFLESTQERLNFGNLFFPFRKERYGNIVFVLFIRSLFIFLWSLLLVIPGIVMGYAYAMVPYLLSENPTMDYRRALALSKEMTQGHKGEMFVLDLSFLGWQMLGFLACGIGILFVNPYYLSTHAQLYIALRAIALDRGIVDLGELEGRA